MKKPARESAPALPSRPARVPLSEEELTAHRNWRPPDKPCVVCDAPRTPIGKIQPDGSTLWFCATCWKELEAAEVESKKMKGAA